MCVCVGHFCWGPKGWLTLNVIGDNGSIIFCRGEILNRSNDFFSPHLYTHTHTHTTRSCYNGRRKTKTSGHFCVCLSATAMASRWLFNDSKQSVKSSHGSMNFSPLITTFLFYKLILLIVVKCRTRRVGFHPPNRSPLKVLENHFHFIWKFQRKRNGDICLSCFVVFGCSSSSLTF